MVLLTFCYSLLNFFHFWSLLSFLLFALGLFVFFLWITQRFVIKVPRVGFLLLISSLTPLSSDVAFWFLLVNRLWKCKNVHFVVVRWIILYIWILSYWLILLFTNSIILLILGLVILSVSERGVLKFPHVLWICFFSFHFYQFLLHVFCDSFTYTYRGSFCLSCGLILLSLCTVLLCL